MSNSRKRSTKIFRPVAADVFNTAVRTFATHYCTDFSFQKKALGLLRSRNYKGLLALGEAIEEELIFAGHGDSDRATEYCGHDKFARASQFTALITKYQYSAKEIPGLDPIAAAIDDFLSAERRNRRTNSIYRAHLQRGTERHWSVAMVRDVFCRVLGRTPPFEDVFDNCDYSGGATTDLSGQSTHMGRKLMAERLEGTKYAFDLFKHAVTRNAHYSSTMLQELADEARTASCVPLNSQKSREGLWAEMDKKFVEQCCDQIKVVPKKAKRGRTIGKPTPVNNYIQKGIDKVLRNKLCKILNLDLSVQSENGLMAYEGSLDHDSDPYVTIDVKGASNSVCLEPIRAVVPPLWFDLLNRTRSTHYSITEEGYRGNPAYQNLRYEMFVSMGNGFCFPLETLLFAAICIAAHRHTGQPCDFRVYGDDIVIRQSHALVVKEILHQFGFKINNEKTCWFGPFRESCGANWYGGRDVVPSYLKERVSTLSKLISLHNGFHKYREVQKALLDMVPVMERPLVPNTRKWSWITDQAFVVPEDIAIGPGLSYFDSETQNFAFTVLVTTPVADDLFWSESRLKHSTQSSLRYAAGLRGSTFGSPFHLRRSVVQHLVDLHGVTSAEQRRLLKRRRAIEDFVGPHRYVIA
ncbi:TPA_asm: RNA-directed RNA polymerase [ssRNA phage SRR7976299_12]|uniref:RNA-directed RNA polymerase n=1 Tax=ssRNA phage SRR7976299_12 TaxID=2786634 RepID=A0A8S5L523_9VIRU|nr:RNA-directed RNA polymerase [ssRNA phage SRR7976299_12]DAD52651.1 TPA_asm: RNA-directed RNA polymerase [ssRNA phage SRR7976299_12]